MKPMPPEEWKESQPSTEAIESAVAWALKQSGISRVEAETDPENTKSQRVFEKCGFAPLGIIDEEGPRFYREN